MGQYLDLQAFMSFLHKQAFAVFIITDSRFSQSHTPKEEQNESGRYLVSPLFHASWFLQTNSNFHFKEFIHIFK